MQWNLKDPKYCVVDRCVCVMQVLINKIIMHYAYTCVFTISFTSQKFILPFAEWKAFPFFINILGTAACICFHFLTGMFSVYDLELPWQINAFKDYFR
jgi:hypothetical protein